MVIASAPGKAILLGEHAVVYPGHEALVGAIQERSWVDVTPRTDALVTYHSDLGHEAYDIADAKDLARKFDATAVADLKKLKEETSSPFAPLKLIAGMAANDHAGHNAKIGRRHVYGDEGSEVPVSSHLGSGSSVFAAYAAALIGDARDKERISKMAYAGDKWLVGTPSGVDNTIVTHGGMLRFYKRKDMNHMEHLPHEGLDIAIANTGVASRTGDMVARVRSVLQQDPGHMHLLDIINDIVDIGASALRRRDIQELGKCMNHNHYILKELGLSIPPIERARDIALEKGRALGAKLTGAGGGGCVIAIGDRPEKIVEAWKDAGFDAWISTWGKAEGVRIETL